MAPVEKSKRKDFIHHNINALTSSLKEVVFGAEDGMVSTLGALTGIAVGTNNHFVVVLAGVVIIAVESLSMAIGVYLSNKSEHEVQKRMLDEELIELREDHDEERAELLHLYTKDGWSRPLAEQMVNEAAANTDLFLKEMAYRELGIIPDEKSNPVRDSAFMFFSYIAGGLIPVLPYLFLTISTGIVVSVILTFIGLFILGVFTTRFTKRSWKKAGVEMLALASAAAVIGIIVGRLADTLISL